MNFKHGSFCFVVLTFFMIPLKASEKLIVFNSLFYLEERSVMILNSPQKDWVKLDCQSFFHKLEFYQINQSLRHPPMSQLTHEYFLTEEECALFWFEAQTALGLPIPEPLFCLNPENPFDLNKNCTRNKL